MSIKQLGNNFTSQIKIKKNKEVEQKESSLNFCATNTLSQDTFTLSNSTQEINTSELKEKLNQTKTHQGYIGKLWDGFKNLTTIGASSKEAQQAIDDYEKGKISAEELNKAVDGYIEGQKMAVDVVADIASGCLSILAFGLAVPTGGASLALGLGVSTLTGATIKTALKASEKKSSGQEYSSKELLYDSATGAINGLLGPITNGIGNTLTKTVATKLGITVLKEGAEEVGRQTILQSAKSIVLNQTDDIIGGTIGKRIAAQSIGMAADGALGGAGDNMVRAMLEGKNVLQAGAEGFVGGLIMAPVIGLGMKGAGTAAKAINGKITMSKVLPDGLSTKFKQGTVGDCALLSTIDGLMNNPTTAKTFKKSITKTAFGDYNVKIGDKIVKVAKSSLNDEMLSDTTGIKLFEQAYKQLNGSIDGGFAEVVAKQFGLNPVHITSDSITDELLDKLTKNQGDTILSLGALVDSNGTITNANGSRHYFTIKNIDLNSKNVTLTSPVNSAETIKLSYEQIKNLGISIDGGTIKKLDLPTAVRMVDDEVFKGIQTPYGELEIINEKSVDAKGTTRYHKKLCFASNKDKHFLEYYDICKILAPERQEFYIDTDGKLALDLSADARYGAIDSELDFVSKDISKKSASLKELYEKNFGTEITLDKDIKMLNVQLRDMNKKIKTESQKLIDKQMPTLKNIYQTATGKDLTYDKDCFEIADTLKQALKELEETNIPTAELEKFKSVYLEFCELNKLQKDCNSLRNSVNSFQGWWDTMIMLENNPEEIVADSSILTVRERNGYTSKKTSLLCNRETKMLLLGETNAEGKNINTENNIYLTYQEMLDCIKLFKGYHFMDTVKIFEKTVDEQRFLDISEFNDSYYGALHSMHRLIQHFGLNADGKLDLGKLKYTLDLMGEALDKNFRNNDSLFSYAGKSSAEAQAGLLISHGKSSGGKTTILFKDNNDPNAKDIITVIFDSDGCLYTIYKQDIEGTWDFIPFKSINA